MTKNIALLFPGQGSQSPGMLSALALQYPLIQKTFAEASRVLGYDLWAVTQDNNPAMLNKTAITQPALLTASIALWRVFCTLSDARPCVLAGHSLGEYTALVCAGALSLTDAVYLVSERGHYMQEAVPAGSGAMAAIVGLDEVTVRQICLDVSSEEHKTVSPANINSLQQIVIAGELNAVEKVMQLSKTAGAKLAKKLDVSVPSHCLLMQDAAQKLKMLLNQLSFDLPVFPIVHNVDAEVHDTLPQIKNALFQQLACPVEWVASIKKIVHNYAPTVFLECGPGKVLTSLNKRLTDIPTLSMAEPSQLMEALQYV